MKKINKRVQVKSRLPLWATGAEFSWGALRNLVEHIRIMVPPLLLPPARFLSSCFIYPPVLTPLGNGCVFGGRGRY